MPESDSGPKPEIVYRSTNDEFGAIEDILTPPGIRVKEPMGFSVFRIGPPSQPNRDFGVRIPVINALGRGHTLDEAVREAAQVVIDECTYLKTMGGKPTPGLQERARQWYERKIEYNP